MKDILYHYCSLETFNSIISNQTIRLSDCTKTNDNQETKWIANLVKDIFLNKIKDSELFCTKYCITDSLIEKIGLQIDATINKVFHENTRKMVTYIACFSEQGDLLSQWRGYANDARGISLGFNKKVLKTFDTGGYNFHFKKVMYSIKEQRKYIENYLGELVTAYELAEANEINNETLNEFIWDMCLHIGAIRNDSPQFKNNAFKEEKEWRLYVNNHLSNVYSYEHDNNDEVAGQIDENYNKKCQYNNGFVREEISFRTTQTKLIPYFDLNFTKIKDNFLKEVIIGSKCEVTIFDIQFFLASQGFDFDKIKIYKSNATYQ